MGLPRIGARAAPLSPESADMLARPAVLGVAVSLVVGAGLTLSGCAGGPGPVPPAPSGLQWPSDEWFPDRVASGIPDGVADQHGIAPATGLREGHRCREAGDRGLPRRRGPRRPVRERRRSDGTHQTGCVACDAAMTTTGEPSPMRPTPSLRADGSARARRRAIRIATVLALTLARCASLLMPTAAPARADGSLHYYYNAHNRVFYARPYEGGGGSVGRGPYYTYAYSPRCDANGPPGNGGADALCGAATTPCPTRGMPRGTLLYYVYRQLPGGPWDQVGTQCLGRGREPTITLDAVLANVREELLRKLVRRTAHINPAAPAKGLVNLPVIMWADAQTETVRLDITERSRSSSWRTPPTPGRSVTAGESRASAIPTTVPTRWRIPGTTG